MSTIYQFFVTTPKAMENILADELKQLGACQVHPQLAGVSFQGNLETAYRVCLWSRIANRVLLPLSSFEVNSQQDLYQGIQAIDWFKHFKPDDSFAVSFITKHSSVINNSHFGALVVKDAIVDQMRAKFYKRPDIQLHQPSIKLNLYLNRQQAQLSLDLSGESLHKRGYRTGHVSAPIKENLAAAMLIRSHWPEIAQQGGSLIDPMCGSGTLLLEAAMIAADYAPGLIRSYFGFIGWKQHDQEIWQKLLTEAEKRQQMSLNKMPMIAGFDVSRRAIVCALQHVDNIHFNPYIHLEKRPVNELAPAASWQPGLVICNPPYGERLGHNAEIIQLYQQLGHTLKNQFQNWQASFIVSNSELGFRLGIRSKKPITLYNGALECKLLRLTIHPDQFFTPKPLSQSERIKQIVQQTNDSHHYRAEMFANRLKKNLKKLSKWAKRQAIDCYRIYDSDLPEYAVAIDLYQSDKIRVNIQEYQAPKNIPSERADQRLAAIISEVKDIFNIQASQIFLKVRQKHKQTEQYEKQASTNRFYAVPESGCQFWVNFEDYIDTGLFLDHRPIRQRIQQQANKKHFLNLFAYTGTASVHAAYGGALSTTTVDMSKVYLQWAKNNFELNRIRGNHHFIQADCSIWLAQQAEQPAMLYDLIFLDPPTFSNSKRMADVLDIQNDHVRLIKNAMRLLDTTGILYFSTNFKQFKLDEALWLEFDIKNITEQTIPEDFYRRPKIHRCWQFTHH